MLWGCKGRAISAPRSGITGSLALLTALALGGCNTNGSPSASVATSRGASVAFESIDGAPPDVFAKLVRDLNDEAQARRLSVTARTSASAFRVRGYLAMQTHKGRGTVSWLWDVYDAEQQRALRITGEETMKARHGDAWKAVDDDTVRKIARRSLDQLAAFLTSPAVAPAEAQYSPAYANSSPEASGIFRVSAPQADPVNTEEAADNSEATGKIAGTIPLPPRRPSAVISAAQTLTLAAARE